MKSDNANFKIASTGRAGRIGPPSVTETARPSATPHRRNRIMNFIPVVFLAICVLPTPCPGATNSTPVYDARVSVAFGPQCETLLVQAIKGAKTEISVAIFTLTDRTIYAAMADAAARGVQVRVKYDKESSEFPSMKVAIGYLKKAGVYCKAISMKGDAKMHHKFTVIDRTKVLTGSYNYTTMATDENHENLVLIDSEPVATRYLTEFSRIR